MNELKAQISNMKNNKHRKRKSSIDSNKRKELLNQENDNDENYVANNTDESNIKFT